jgi:SAM-dependent methyltransferase
MTDDAGIREQLEYYRARSGEYDQWWLRQGRYDRGAEENARWFDEAAAVTAALERFAPTGRVLELACGTGLWSERLLRFATELTLVDGSRVMLALAERRLRSPDVRTVRADLFRWRPTEVYDRYQGVYANRLRRAYREARAQLAGEAAPAGVPKEAAVGLDVESPSAPPGSAEALRRQAWARMLRKVFEVEPLVCPRCRREGRTVEMEVVAWITDLEVVDRILKHRRERGLASAFETPPARAPPVA